MRISSQALAVLGKVFRQMSPSEGDLNLTIPPVVQPTIVLRAPTGEQTVDTFWSTSGYFQQGQSVLGPAGSNTVIAATLDKGMWELVVDFSMALITISATLPNPGWALFFTAPATGLGGEVCSMQYGTLVPSVQHLHFSEIYSFVEPIQLFTTLRTHGVTGQSQSWLSIQANRLFD